MGRAAGLGEMSGCMIRVASTRWHGLRSAAASQLSFRAEPRCAPSLLLLTSTVVSSPREKGTPSFSSSFGVGRIVSVAEGPVTNPTAGYGRGGGVWGATRWAGRGLGRSSGAPSLRSAA